jgi:hypothetical protein
VKLKKEEQIAKAFKKKGAGLVTNNFPRTTTKVYLSPPGEKLKTNESQN